MAEPSHARTAFASSASPRLGRLHRPRPPHHRWRIAHGGSGHAHPHRRTQWRGQERAPPALPRPAGTDLGHDCVASAGASRRGAATGDGFSTSRAAPPLRAGERRARAGDRARASERARDSGARGARHCGAGAARLASHKRAFRRRAAARGVGAGLGAASRSVVSRRADRQPRSRCDPRDRAGDRRDARGGHEDRDGHSQSRPGAKARRRDRFSIRGTRARARARGQVLQAAASREAARFLEGESPW